MERISTSRLTTAVTAVILAAGVWTYAYMRGTGSEKIEVGLKIDDFLDILRRVNQPELKVNLDTSNTLMAGDDPVRLTREVRDHVVHVHASDRLSNAEHCTLGQGIVPFPEIFNILKGAGYDGWISMEVGGTKGEDGIRQSRDYVQKTWEAASGQ